MKEASIVASALYLDRPFFGSRRMAVTLGVGRTRIRRLMRILGIEAHYRCSGPTLDSCEGSLLWMNVAGADK